MISGHLHHARRYLRDKVDDIDLQAMGGGGVSSSEVSLGQTTLSLSRPVMRQGPRHPQNIKEGSERTFDRSQVLADLVRPFAVEATFIKQRSIHVPTTQCGEQIGCPLCSKRIEVIREAREHWKGIYRHLLGCPNSRLNRIRSRHRRSNAVRNSSDLTTEDVELVVKHDGPRYCPVALSFKPRVAVLLTHTSCLLHSSTARAHRNTDSPQRGTSGYCRDHHSGPVRDISPIRRKRTNRHQCSPGPCWSRFCHDLHPSEQERGRSDRQPGGGQWLSSFAEP